MDWQEEDKRFLDSVAVELDEYLQSSVYDWPLPNFRLRMTPGRILFSLKRSTVLLDQDGSFSDTKQKIEKIIQSHHFYWNQKLELEFPRRLRVWENIINDYLEEGLDKSILVQIINRVILKLIEIESPIIAARYTNRINIIDEKYRRMVRAGNFIWDEKLTLAFPEIDFWFLYQEPAKG